MITLTWSELLLLSSLPLTPNTKNQQFTGKLAGSPNACVDVVDLHNASGLTVPDMVGFLVKAAWTRIELN